MSIHHKAYEQTPEDSLVEEVGELLQALAKCKRFGWFNYHPETKVYNIDALCSEMDDVNNAMERVLTKIRYVKHLYHKG